MSGTTQLGTLYPLYVNRVTPITTYGGDIAFPGEFDLVACLTNTGFDGSTDGIDASSMCSGIFKDSIPGQVGWTMSGTGESINITGADGRVSHNDLAEMWKNRTVAWWAIYDTALSSVRYGKGYISAYADANPNNAVKTFTITIQGKGEPFTQVATS